MPLHRQTYEVLDSRLFCELAVALQVQIRCCAMVARDEIKLIAIQFFSLVSSIFYLISLHNQLLLKAIHQTAYLAGLLSLGMVFSYNREECDNNPKTDLEKFLVAPGKVE